MGAGGAEDATLEGVDGCGIAAVAGAAEGAPLEALVLGNAVALGDGVDASGAACAFWGGSVGAVAPLQLAAKQSDTQLTALRVTPLDQALHDLPTETAAATV